MIAGHIYPTCGRLNLVLRTVKVIADHLKVIAARMNLAWRTVKVIWRHRAVALLSSGGDCLSNASIRFTTSSTCGAIAQCRVQNVRVSHGLGLFHHYPGPLAWRVDTPPAPLSRPDGGRQPP